MSSLESDTTTLYRPVGRRELALIAEQGFRAFPKRLPGQPFFYPVLTEAYATQIARDWNTKDEASEYVGYVTRFRVTTEFFKRYAVQTVGAGIHKELWIPAADLDTLNCSIVGTIEVMSEYRGPQAIG